VQSPIDSPALSVPGPLDAAHGPGRVVGGAAEEAGLAPTTVTLVDPGASQINGRALCLDIRGRAARRTGHTDERLLTLVAWLDALYFTDSERAAPALTQAAPRLAHRAGSATDEVFAGAVKHSQKAARAASIVHSAASNLANRINLTTVQWAGAWTARVEMP